MSECPRSHELIDLLVGGEASAIESFESHTTTCEDCRAVLQAHRKMERIGREIGEPSDADFELVRANVLAEAVGRAAHRSSRDPRWWRGGWFPGARPLAATIAGSLLLGTGFLAGRGSAVRSALDDDALLHALSAESATSGGLADYWDGRLTYTNVTVRPVDGDRLALGFDACRHVNVVAERESNLAREVLLHAILDPSSLGTRLKAVALAGETDDGRLREGVIFALHHDPEIAVRLAALEVLAQLPFDGTVQAALLQTLANDVAVQMRLRALAVLGSRRTGTELLRRTIHGGLEADPAVIQRAEELIHEEEGGRT